MNNSFVNLQWINNKRLSNPKFSNINEVLETMPIKFGKEYLVKIPSTANVLKISTDTKNTGRPQATADNRSLGIAFSDIKFICK